MALVIIIKMLGIFFFEMLGTAAITGPASIFYEQATQQVPAAAFEFSYQQSLLYMCMIYFAMLLICTPVSGGHFNPALTFSVFLICPNKRDKISKLVLMVSAQFVGGLIGLGWGRIVRFQLLKDPAAKL